MTQAREPTGPASPRSPAPAGLGKPGDPSDPETRRNLPFNFRLLLLHGMFGQTGFRLVNAPTFLPDADPDPQGNHECSSRVQPRSVKLLAARF